MTAPGDDGSRSREEFIRQADARQAGLVRELLAMLRSEKKWFLLPILLVLLISGIFVVLSTTAVGPFIYTLF